MNLQDAYYEQKFEVAFLRANGAAILRHLSHPVTVSALWEKMPRAVPDQKASSPMRYDGFVLALDLLFLIGAIELREGLLVRGAS